MVDIFFLFGSYFQEDFEPRPRYCLIVVAIMITNSNYINFDYFSYLKCVNIKDRGFNRRRLPAMDRRLLSFIPPPT